MINLYEYQKKYLADLPPRAIMAADTGVGKTFMALAHYQKHAPVRFVKRYDTFNKTGEVLKEYTERMPLLILAPASKVRTGDWEREITEYFGVGNEPEYVIYSYEKFSRNPTLKQISKGARAIWHQYAPKHGGKQWAVICDEVHRCKNPQSGIGKAVWQAANGASFFVGLSATPLPNGWIDFAGYSKLFGFTKNITAFKNKYCQIEKYKGFPEIIGYYHENELIKQWNSISKKLTKAEALDLPSRKFIGVDFKKAPIYTTTILDRKAPDGKVLDSAPALAHALRQTLTTAKIEYLSDLIEGTDQNLVIFYNYISEREAIMDMLSKKHPKRPLYRQDGDKHELPSKENWGDVHNSITLSHYKSGSTGVEMTYATLVVYFSPTYSFADYVQSIGRVYRNGQTQKTTFYNFRTPNTIEEEVYNCISNKRDFQDSQWSPK